MAQLVAENQLQLLPAVVPARQHQPHGAQKAAHRERRAHLPRDHHRDVAPDAVAPQLCMPLLQQRLIPLRDGVPQQQPAKLQMGDHLPHQKAQKAQKPHRKHRLKQGLGQREHRKRPAVVRSITIQTRKYSSPGTSHSAAQALALTALRNGASTSSSRA